MNIDEHTSKINALKQRIRDFNEKTRSCIKEYHLRWNGSSFDGVKDFAKMLAEDIKEVLMPQWMKYEKLTPFQKERMAHHTFIREKSEIFRARRKEAYELIEKIKSEPVTIIKGAVGSGKSTLFSYIAQNMMNMEWTVLPFISGLTTNSDTAFEIISNIVYYFENECGISEHYIDETDRMTLQRKTHSIEEWREKIAELCWRYTETGKKLLIMVDAADQLTQSKERDNLYFIPTNINENIHFVMTCTIDFETAGRDFYTLKEIDEGGKCDVINGTLARSGKQLSKPVMDKMLTLSASDNPLYLSLLVQRLTMMNREDFAEIKNKGDGMSAIEQHQIELIEKKCPDNLEEMSAELLLEAGRRINPELVSKAGQYIAVSRAGLRKKDLSALLGETWTDIDFSHFISYMNDCFMLRDDGRYDFMHKSIREGFLKKCDSEKINLEILSHLKTLPKDDPVRIAEVVYYAIKVDDKPFFIDYIIEREYDNDTLCIRQASVDTYKQCISDKGKWICDIINYNLLTIKDTVFYFINFIIFHLNSFFENKQIELEINLTILELNAEFSKYLNNQIQTDYSKRCLAISLSKVANILVELEGNDNLIKALQLVQTSNDIFKQIGNGTFDNENKRDLALSYYSLGYIHEHIGGKENLLKALDWYQKMNGIFEQMNGNGVSERELSLSYNSFGRIYEQLGGKENLLKALDLYKMSIELLKQFYAIGNINKSKKDLFICYTDVARIYEKLGDEVNLFKALDLYQKCSENFLHIEKTLGTLQSKMDLASSYCYIGYVYMQLGNKENLIKALDLYKKSHNIFLFLEKTMKTLQSKKELVISYEHIGIIYELFDNKENLMIALEYYEKSLELAKSLCQNSKTSESKKIVSVEYKNVAAIYEKLGGKENLLKAFELYVKCLNIRKEIERTDNTIISKRDLAISYENVARIYERCGGRYNIRKALELYQKGDRIFEEIVNITDMNENKRDYAVSCANIGDIYEQIAKIRPFCRKKYLKKSFLYYQKSLIISEQLAETCQTIIALEDLTLRLYRVAVHRYTDQRTKKQLVKRGLDLAKTLYNNIPNEKYKNLVEMFEEELNKMIK